MTVEELKQALNQYDSSYPIYIDLGNGPLPLEKIEIDGENNVSKILVLKSFDF